MPSREATRDRFLMWSSSMRATERTVEENRNFFGNVLQLRAQHLRNFVEIWYDHDRIQARMAGYDIRSKAPYGVSACHCWPLRGVERCLCILTIASAVVFIVRPWIEVRWGVVRLDNEYVSNHRTWSVKQVFLASEAFELESNTSIDVFHSAERIDTVFWSNPNRWTSSTDRSSPEPTLLPFNSFVKMISWSAVTLNLVLFLLPFSQFSVGMAVWRSISFAYISICNIRR